MLATGGETSASRPVKAPLSLSFDSVNRLFAILFQNFRSPQKSDDFVSSFR
jgi:hypothetical protein